MQDSEDLSLESETPENKEFVDLTAKKFNITDISLDERISILGKTGTGKSYYLCYLIHKFSRKVLVIIADPKDEYKEVPEAPKNWLKIEKGVFKCTYIKYKGREFRDFKILAEFLCENGFDRGNICLVMEECGEYIKKTGRLYDTMPHFARYLSQGRKRNCSLICTTQRSQDMHTSILSQSEHVFCFKLSSPHDQDAVKKYIDPKWFNSLKDWQYFHYNVNDNLVRRRFGLFTKDQAWGLRLLGRDHKIKLEE